MVGGTARIALPKLAIDHEIGMRFHGAGGGWIGRQCPTADFYLRRGSIRAYVAWRIGAWRD
jgi:hypothetical protein